MSQQPNQQLEEHTLRFAQAVRDFGKVLPMTVANVEDLKQLIRSSGNVGATCVQALTAPGRREYVQYLQTCFSETHATRYWLQLVDTQGAGELELQRRRLIQAAQELAALFTRLLQTAPTR
ncbi:MAG: hypothetical protein OHK0039_40090 [Bacteroidia bacterium]